MILPLFFFEGNAKEPINPNTVEQMGLESLSEAELASLGILRAAQDIGDLMMPEVPAAFGVSTDYR